VSRKRTHRTLVYIFANLFSYYIFKIISLGHSAVNFQRSDQDPASPQTRRYTTVWNINYFRKLNRRRALQRPMQARTEKNATAVDELILGHEDQPQIHNLSRQTLHSALLQNHIFHRDLGLKCLMGRLLKNWLKQLILQDSVAHSSCWWMMLASFIGVGAHSTLGSTTFLPEKYVWKLTKCTNFTWFLPEKY